MTNKTLPQPARLRAALYAAAGAAVLVGCSTQAPAPVFSAPGAKVPAPAAAPAPARSYGNVVDYRHAAGNAIYAANASMRSTGTLPALLRAIVVVEVEVDGSGRLALARIKRSGADSTLDPVALDTLRKTQLPVPSRNLLNRRGTVEYMETWFFDKEGKFQLMAFNPPQASQ
jgi:periplasmic protein TonB